jgi:eukaryotic-like serine/threonine-protein kinase
MKRTFWAIFVSLLGAIGAVASPPPADMVLIPAGSFWQGCIEGDACHDNERPGRVVTIDAFWLDVHEVTVAEYAKCVATQTCRTPNNKKPPGLEAKWARYDRFYTWDRRGRENHPVNGVSWDDATNYCRSRGKRLPTESEFERALRGGLEKRIYPWGDARRPPEDFGNFADEAAHAEFSFWRRFENYDDGFVGSSPVCSFKKNPFGLCDISGNVWEWCADTFQPDAYSHLPDKNPFNNAPGQNKVIRGGGFRGTPNSAAASRRDGLSQNEYVSSRGFRCAWRAKVSTPQ